MKLFLILSLLTVSVMASSNGVKVNKMTSDKSSVVVGENDSLSVTVCKNLGLVINFDDFLKSQSPDLRFLRAIISDKTHFNTQMFDSGKGMFITYSPNKATKIHKATLFATYHSGKELVITLNGKSCTEDQTSVVVNVASANSTINNK